MKVDFTILLIWSIAVVFLCVNAVLDYRNTKKRKVIIAELREELERSKKGSVLDCLIYEPKTIAECRYVINKLNDAIFYLTFKSKDDALKKQILEFALHKKYLTQLLIKEMFNSIEKSV